MSDEQHEFLQQFYEIAHENVDPIERDLEVTADDNAIAIVMPWVQYPGEDHTCVCGDIHEPGRNGDVGPELCLPAAAAAALAHKILKLATPLLDADTDADTTSFSVRPDGKEKTGE